MKFASRSVCTTQYLFLLLLWCGISFLLLYFYLPRRFIPVLAPPTSIIPVPTPAVVIPSPPPSDIPSKTVADPSPKVVPPLTVPSSSVSKSSPSISVPISPPPTPASTTPTRPSNCSSRLLPTEYWKHRREHPESYTSPTCTEVPGEEDIEYAAAFWQRHTVENGSVYLYAAHWDGRASEPLVRVLLYTDVGDAPELYCQLWYYNEAAPQVVTAHSIYGWNKAWGGPTPGVNEPYIVSCNPTFHHHHPQNTSAPPAAVSIVSAPCEKATNVLNIQNTPSPTEKPPTPSDTSVMVCLKWMDYGGDISAQVLEWLLLLQYFEAQTVYVYLIRAHANVLRVLNHFSSLGFVHLTELAHPPWLEGPAVGKKYPRGSRDFHDFRRELLPLNDCLYRAQGRYRWMAVFDADEIIVPVVDHTYPRLISKELSKPADALVCRNVYYIDAAQKDHKAPPYARMLAHTWRARETSGYGDRVKSFHNVQTVVAMHNHFPRSCGDRSCQTRTFDDTVARLQHYRAKCAEPAGSEACKKATEDVIREATLEPWRDRLLEDIPKTLKQLGLPIPTEEKSV